MASRSVPLIARFMKGVGDTAKIFRGRQWVLLLHSELGKFLCAVNGGKRSEKVQKCHCNCWRNHRILIPPFGGPIPPALAKQCGVLGNALRSAWRLLRTNSQSPPSHLAPLGGQIVESLRSSPQIFPLSGDRSPRFV